MGSITGAGLLINGIIASRVLPHKAPDKRKQHEEKSLFRRILKVVRSSLSICILPAVRTKTQGQCNLNIWGTKKEKDEKDRPL